MEPQERKIAFITGISGQVNKQTHYWKIKEYDRIELRIKCLRSKIYCYYFKSIW